MVRGTSVSSAEASVRPAASSAPRTAARSPGSVVTCHCEPSSAMSSAPASRAVSIRASSSRPSPSTRITPLRSNCHATLPGVPREPPFFVKMWRTSLAVRLRLSVRISAISAAPAGP